MAAILSVRRSRRRAMREPELMYQDPALNPTAPDNWKLLREIHDFYMACHNFEEEDISALEELKLGGFDIEKLQDAGRLRFLTAREGSYRARQNALMRLQPSNLIGTIVEFDSVRYRIINYVNDYPNPFVEVSRSERRWLGFGDYDAGDPITSRLPHRPRNGLELLAYVLQQKRVSHKE